MAELLVEALSEEIPARMQQRAAEDLAQIFEAELKKVGLSYEIAEHFNTVRWVTTRTANIKGRTARSPS